MRCYRNLLLAMTVLGACIAALAQGPSYNLGKTPTSEEIQAWDIAIGPSGRGLPPGSGTAKEGAEIYAQKCAVCHGANGEGRVGRDIFVPRLVGGYPLDSLRPVKTIGSWWPFATTVWDFINKAMPLKAEGSLKPDEVYALTAFLLYKNEIIKESDIVDANSLPKIQMRNRNGFVPSRWQDIRLPRCRLGNCP